MSARGRRPAVWSASALATALLAPHALADGVDVSRSLDVSYLAATGIDGGEADQSRLEVRPELALRFKGGWRAEMALRLEASAADAGLGTIDTYGAHSRPLELGPDARVEIESATLSWRKQTTRLTLGKQVLAWGVLDGLQVTDRFDAVRRRDALFSETRPERISRWGARAEFAAADIKWDAAMLLDGTSDQLARPGDTFSPRAPRFRAGMPAGASLPDLTVNTPDRATVGLRGTRRIGSNDASVMMIHGPDTEPVFRATTSGVSLEYDTRTLVGATWQRSAGPRVWRIETAWIGDQPVNLMGPSPSTVRRQRWLGGIGVDWDLPGDTFLNAQVATDHVTGSNLVRPATDVLATLRVQKQLANQVWGVSAEVIGSLSDGDGAFRPAVSWNATDRLRLQAGADLIWGDDDQLFGQFDHADRIWFRLRWAS